MRLLIAHDDPRVVHALQRLSPSWGFAPQAISQPESFLPSVRSCKTQQLVVLDAAMAGPEIFKMCRAVRQSALNNRIYLLVLTWPPGPQWRTHLMAAGADDHMLKPFEPEAMRGRLSVARRILRLEEPMRLPGVLGAMELTPSFSLGDADLAPS